MAQDWLQAAKAENFLISTPRLLIRPLAETDLQLYLDLYTNPETMAFVGEPLSAEKASSSFQIALRLNAKTPFKRLFLSIVVQGRNAGLCAINQWHSETAEVEIGIMLLRSSQGQGYAKEALVALIQRVQQQFRSAVVKADLEAENKAAMQLALKIGFEPDINCGKTYWLKKSDDLLPC